MDTRRDFIRKGAIMGAALCLPLCRTQQAMAAPASLKTRNPQKALILCYSQTGHTRRYARLIGCTLKGRGIHVDEREMRAFDRISLPKYDWILVGTPVFYYDAPSNVCEILKTIPAITGTPVAAFVSFGGPEGNQHNASCHILKILAEKGGVPVGRDAFRNVPTYPTPGWNSANQVSGEGLPDRATFDRVRRFATDTLARISRGETVPVDYEMAWREILRAMPLVWLNKKLINRHTVDTSKCIRCGTCVKTCPARAIDPYTPAVDQDRCLACFGCLNNCPAHTVVMEYGGKPLYGFPEYLRRKKITIMEPPEFRTCT